jgi:hypothetical protein
MVPFSVIIIHYPGISWIKTFHIHDYWPCIRIIKVCDLYYVFHIIISGQKVLIFDNIRGNATAPLVLCS